MTDSITSSYVCDYTTVFSAAMPPILSSQTGSSSALVKPVSTALTTMTTTTASPLANRERLSFRTGETGVRSRELGRTLFDISGAALHTRQMEAALLSREIQLRGEFDRLRHAEEERIRWNHQREREAAHAEERQRMLDAAKAIELERARRTEEQQQRVLAQARELEEWKHEKAKEIEEERRRRMEEEERLRTREHEREMLRMREESELRLKAQRSVDDNKKAMQSTVESAKESVMTLLRGEFKELESQWTGRFERLQLERISETNSLRQEIEHERQAAARSESQLAETREQLYKLMSQLEELRRQKDAEAKNRTTETSLTEIHQKAIERFQRAFEDERENTKQRFVEEQQRMQSSHERTIREVEDNHRAQVRRLEEMLDESKRRVREVESEAQEYKIKLAASAINSASASSEEVRLREEVRSVRKQLNEAVEAKQRTERRYHEVERERNEERKAHQAIQMELNTFTTRHDAELRSLREESQQLADELSRTKAAHEEELQTIRRNQRSSENAATCDATKGFEATLRRMDERHDDMKRTLEAEKGQLTRQLRAVEQQYEETRQRLELEVAKSETARREGERQQQQQGEKDRIIAELQETIEKFKRKDDSVAEFTLKNHKLQLELEQSRRDYEAIVHAKGTEIEKLHRDIAEDRRRNAALQDELTSMRRMREEAETQMKRLLNEVELKEKQLRRSAEEAAQTAQSWKERYTQLQNQSASSAPKMQSLLSEKENEISRLQGTLDTLRRDRDALEHRVQELQTTSTRKDQELLDQASAVKGLNEEIASLREQLSTSMRSTKEMPLSYSSQSLGSFSPPAAAPTAGGSTNAQITPPLTTTSLGVKSLSVISPSPVVGAGISTPPRPSIFPASGRGHEVLTTPGYRSQSTAQQFHSVTPSTTVDVPNLTMQLSTPVPVPASPPGAASSATKVPVPSASPGAATTTATTTAPYPGYASTLAPVPASPPGAASSATKVPVPSASPGAATTTATTTAPYPGYASTLAPVPASPPGAASSATKVPMLSTGIRPTQQQMGPVPAPVVMPSGVYGSQHSVPSAQPTPTVVPSIIAVTPTKTQVTPPQSVVSVPVPVPVPISAVTGSPFSKK